MTVSDLLQKAQRISAGHTWLLPEDGGNLNDQTSGSEEKKMGIRQLTEADRERTLQFLEQEIALNLFLIGDIYNYGFDKEFQQLWGGL